MVLNKFVKHLKVYFAQSNWDKKAIWLTADYPGYASLSRHKLVFHRFNLELERGEHEFLIDGFEYLKQLCEWGKFSFSIIDDTVIAKGHKIITEIHTAEELFILREIFLSKDYNFQSLGDVVVIDVGMNIGLASLYFASREDVEHVYGFEPFKPTYQQCIHNLSKNEKLARKITAVNFGLASKKQRLEVDYDFDNKGQVGIHGTTLVKSTVKRWGKEEIELLPILPEIENIIKRFPKNNLVLKIDCEGGEYDIFKSFSEQGIPENIKIIMMEWHLEGVNSLLEVLCENEFESVTTCNYRQDVGMIYAFRG